MHTHVFDFDGLLLGPPHLHLECLLRGLPGVLLWAALLTYIYIYIYIHMSLFLSLSLYIYIYIYRYIHTHSYTYT